MFGRHELRITNASAIRYTMPLKRAYGTARGVTRAGVNFLVELKATYRGQRVEGVGECQPRHLLTGDGGKDRVAAWGFACAAIDSLEGRSLKYRSREGAVDAIRKVMADLQVLARKHADDSNRERPFRGTLLGFEVALLDAAARSLKLQVSELLGKQREAIGVSISTISSTVTPAELADRVIKQRRFPMTRVKGTGDVDGDLTLLKRVAEANRSAGRDKPLWIDINEAMTFDDGSVFIEGVAREMASGHLPENVLIEGMLPKAQVTRLPELQTIADDACAAHSGLDLRIMPDEGLWDTTDLQTINDHGGCRALNIKAPKAGGLLASLDLATAAVAADPGIHISLGGMIGTSDITAWALHNLARALPRIDYLTAVPPGNVEARISDPIARYQERDSNMIALQADLGLGTRLRHDALAPYIDATHTSGQLATASAPSAASGRAEEASSRTLVFGGDTSLGDVYVANQGGALGRRLSRDPMSFFAGLAPTVAGADFTLLNLETVLADSPKSPFEGKKPYLGWDSPQRTVDCLKQLGVSAVSLANNHTMDFGSQHLLETIEVLEAAGIQVIGAGADRDEAAKPLTIPFQSGREQHRVHVFAAMQIQSKLRDEFDFYAGSRKPGVSSLSMTRTTAAIRTLRESDPTSLIIVFPHWGRNYQWADERLQSNALKLQEAGADLVIGHGAHMLQQCSFNASGAVVYSLGNFLFNWGGRFEKMGAPPYGLVARLSLGRRDQSWRGELRLYPVTADNRKSGHRPAPVGAADFEAVWSVLREHDLDGTFARSATRGEDRIGHYISHSFVSGGSRARTLSTAPGETRHDRPRTDNRGTGSAPPPPSTADSDRPREPNTYTDPESVEIMRKLDRRLLSSLLIAREAEADGAQVEWLASDTFIATTPDGEMLFKGNRCTESVPATRLVRDKGLLKEVLSEAGVPTPRGGSVTSFKEAAALFETLNGPAVVKPRRGDRGVGVFTNITDLAELERAFNKVNSADGVLVEEFLDGPEYRCVTTETECLGVLRRDAPHVVGDGRHTIAELIEMRNSERRRNPHLQNRLVKIDPETEDFLARRHLSLTTVPQSGEKLYVGGAANFTRGADSIECTDQVSAAVKDAAVAAVQAVPGLGLCGVDVITRTSGDPKALVLEINVNAGIAGFHYPVHGRPRNIARQIWTIRKANLVSGADGPGRSPGEQAACPPPGMSPTTGILSAQNEIIDIGKLLRQALERDATVADLSPRTVLVRAGEHTSLVHGCAGSDSLATVALVVSRPSQLRRLLTRAGVGTPEARIVREVKELCDFVAAHGAVLLMPPRNDPNRRIPLRLSRESDEEQLEGAWRKAARDGRAFVQQLPDGVRLTTLSTRSETLAVIAHESASTGIAASDLEELTRTAAKAGVSAIRAVPELRYGSVDLVVPAQGNRTYAAAAPMIEAVATDPRVPTGSRVLAGSITAFVETVRASVLQATSERTPEIQPVVNGGVRTTPREGKRAGPREVPHGLAAHSQAGLIAVRAVSRGIAVSRVGGSQLRLEHDGHVHMFRSGWSTLNTPLARRCAQQKEVTSRLLREQGIPAPKNCVFAAGEVERAWGWAEGALPVVLKPNAANKGTLVFVGVNSRPDFVTVFERISREYGQVLVEEIAHGEEHRFAVLDEEILAVTNRVPPSVTGDGVSTVRGLIERLNHERATSGNPLHRKPIDLDEAVHATLSSQGTSLDAVPKDGTQLLVRRTSNISIGGLAIDKTDEVSSDVMKVVEEAARALPGLRLAGFDILIPDGTGQPTVLEVNPNPMLSMHVFPWRGTPRNVYDRVLDAMFPATASVH